MAKFIRSIVVSLGYMALANGFRLPHPKTAAAFDQWSHLIDLTRRLRINVFLDVGANRGFFSKHLRMSGYRGHLFSFEPIPSDQAQIRKYAANDASWKVCGYALGAENGRKEFQINLSGHETVMSSFLPLKEPSLGSQTIEVDIRRLEDVLPELIKGIESPRIFLKMDTQGYDANVIHGAGKCLDQILAIQSEISLIPRYDGLLHYTESLALYERFGFALLNLFVVSRMPDGRVVEYDCVMARPNALEEWCLTIPNS
jgi:FkbM family methyltransferase